MFLDLYEITMAYAYWKSGKINDHAVFDLFFRKNPFQGEFTIFAGLKDCIEFLNKFHYSPSGICWSCLLCAYIFYKLHYIISYFSRHRYQVSKVDCACYSRPKILWLSTKSHCKKCHNIRHRWGIGRISKVSLGNISLLKSQCVYIEI